MVTEPLDYLVSWFRSHCDGDWENEGEIRIGTLDNPGWWLTVTLVGTELEGRTLDRGLVQRSEDDWIDVRSDGNRFEGNGGPSNIRELLAAFQAFAEGRSNG